VRFQRKEKAAPTVSAGLSGIDMGGQFAAKRGLGCCAQWSPKTGQNSDIEVLFHKI
jgi:hypothetical protein